MASFGSFLTFITSMACDAAVSIGGGDDDYAADGRATVGNLGPQFNVVLYKKGVSSTFCKVVGMYFAFARLQNLNYLPWSCGYSVS